jgi:RNA polymerase sigma factor (sigma-70 family)
MAAPSVNTEVMPNPDRGREAKFLADQANAEWGLLEKVLSAFVTTAIQGVANDMQVDDVSTDSERQWEAADLCEELGREMKTLVLERVASRLAVPTDSDQPGQGMAQASTSVAMRGSGDSPSLRGYDSSRLRAGLPSLRAPQWSSGVGPRLWASASQVAEDEPLPPAARSLYAENYDLVLRLAAGARRRSGLPESVLDELEDVALKSLTRAARSYDPGDARGASFNTFLFSQITPDLAKACRKISKRLGHTVADGEVADLPDTGRGVAADVEDENLKKLLEREIRRLPPRQAEIVERHIGLGDRPRMSLKQIAVQMGMNDASARRLFGQGLRRLRQALVGQGIEAFMSKMLASPVYEDEDRPTLSIAGRRYEVGETMRVAPYAA